MNKFRKNLMYPNIGINDREKSSYHLKHLIENVWEGKDRYLDTFIIGGRLYHEIYGEQVVIQKEVSDDLIKTDVKAIALSDLPLLHDSLEFYFEDPNLGTFLLTAGNTLKFLNKLGVYDVPFIDKNFLNFSCNHSEHGDMVTLLSTDKDIKKADIVSTVFKEKIDKEVSKMIMLCCKVLIYASIPKLKPQKVTKKQLKFGGKPKVKGRPNIPINRVVYLPREQIIAGQGITEETGKTHNFYGRRGFMRTYRHDRYKKMKGKIQYIPPVVGTKPKPKTKYKVVYA